MAKLIVSEKVSLKGKVRISGSKNSVLPIIAASLLASDQSIIHDAPYLNDVKIMCDLLRSLGATVEISPNEKYVKIDHRESVIPVPHMNS